MQRRWGCTIIWRPAFERPVSDDGGAADRFADLAVGTLVCGRGGASRRLADVLRRARADGRAGGSLRERLRLLWTFQTAGRFKSSAAIVQDGVWVRPRHRGQGQASEFNCVFYLAHASDPADTGANYSPQSGV